MCRRDRDRQRERELVSSFDQRPSLTPPTSTSVYLHHWLLSGSSLSVSSPPSPPPHHPHPPSPAFAASVIFTFSPFFDPLADIDEFPSAAQDLVKTSQESFQSEKKSIVIIVGVLL